MAQNSDKTKNKKQPQDRDERLKAALKANLQRRKSQARVRSANKKQEE